MRIDPKSVGTGHHGRSGDGDELPQPGYPAGPAWREGARCDPRQEQPAMATSSDRRVTENTKPIEHGLDTVMKIPAVQFTFISDANKRPVEGFIAQDVQKIFPGELLLQATRPQDHRRRLETSRRTP